MANEILNLHMILIKKKNFVFYLGAKDEKTFNFSRNKVIQSKVKKECHFLLIQLAKILKIILNLGEVRYVQTPLMGV